jgi:hypothetical protein
VNAPPVHYAEILFAYEISMEANWLWSCTDAKLCNISIYLFDFANYDEADAGELLVALFLCCP